jgi:uncharacterized protein YfaS (alpha-2-macroglobulin family)
MTRPRFSLDPLLAEAKRRARQRRLVVALIAAVVVAAGAVLTVELRGRGSAVPVPANLTVLVVGPAELDADESPVLTRARLNPA